MEKVYWISKTSELNQMNRELEKYGGHVTMIVASPATDDQDYAAHAFVVIAYPRDTLSTN